MKTQSFLGMVMCALVGLALVQLSTRSVRAEATSAGSVTKVSADAKTATASAAATSVSSDSAIKVKLDTETKANSVLGAKRDAAEAVLKQKQTEDQSTTPTKAPDALKNCDAIQVHISTVTARYDSDKDKNVTAYKNMHDRLTTLIARFTAKGVDTTTITYDLTVLDGKVVTLQADHAAYITALLNTKQYVCGKSQGQFKTALDDARKQMAAVKADISAIQNFYQTTIKTDLTALKATVAATEKTTASTDATTTTTGAAAAATSPSVK